MACLFGLKTLLLTRHGTAHKNKEKKGPQTDKNKANLLVGHDARLYAARSKVDDVQTAVVSERVPATGETSQSPAFVCVRSASKKKCGGKMIQK
jgi:hypothetical protein